MLAVVVPCYNEVEVIDKFSSELKRLRRSFEFDLIFVDDGSDDGTSAKLKTLSDECAGWIKIRTHRRNMGIAQSLKDGFSYALNSGYMFIAQMDCDLTHPPVLLPKMMEEAKDADLVIASRYVSGGGMKDVPAWRVAISKAGNTLFRLALKIKTRDATSGYRLAKSAVYESISLEADSFGIQLEITVKTERAGFSVKEVPLMLTNRAVGTSKFKLKYLLEYIPLLFKLMLKR